MQRSSSTKAVSGSIKTFFENMGAAAEEAAAFACAKGLVGKGEFVGIAGDIVTEAGAIKKLMLQHGGKLTMGLKAVEEPSRYGVVKLGQAGRIAEFAEKPKKAASRLVNTSIYVFDGSIFPYLEKAEKGLPAAAMLGLSLASNQFIWLAFPFMALMYASARRYRELAASLAVFGAVVAPFFLANPSEFLRQISRRLNHGSM
jgi:hypothetical protein